MILSSVLKNLGNTPCVKLDADFNGKINLYAKLEMYNPNGSVKDRAAYYIIRKLLDLKEINDKTVLIESSSGNFGIALSAFSKYFGLEFICVVDPHISPVNEMLIRSMGAKIIKVSEPDENGGYLLTRIKKVKELNAAIKNSYWVNQYGNPYNAEAYYNTLGVEICNEFSHLDYIFMGVSSGGTITGVSRKVREKFPGIKVIAVDIFGSVIFGGKPRKRFIPGIGSSMVPSILSNAFIHDHIMVDEMETVLECRELLNKHFVFAGGSSGSVMAGIRKYFKEENARTEQGPARRSIEVLTIFPDRGDRYMNTVYNDEWVEGFREHFHTAGLRNSVSPVR